MQITKEDLAKGFSIWQQRVQQNPQSFDSNQVWRDASVPDTESADYLWEILKEMKGNE